MDISEREKKPLRRMRARISMISAIMRAAGAEGFGLGGWRLSGVGRVFVHAFRISKKRACVDTRGNASAVV
jgi:hypothetical protein